MGSVVHKGFTPDATFKPLGNATAVTSKRLQAPRKLNTIKEGYKTAVNEKFVKTTTSNWNKGGKYLNNTGNISDFKGLPIKNNRVSTDSAEQLARHSEIANVAESEAATTGFKNIKDYLQEANIDTLRKSENCTVKNQFNNGQVASGRATVQERRKGAHSMTQGKWRPAQMPYILGPGGQNQASGSHS